MSYEENKNNYLRSIGVADPENYDIQQDGRVTPRQAVAQEVVQEPSSWVDAAKSALYNAPRNIAGFAGGAGGVALAGLAGLPSGPGAIATGIGGALAGGFAGSAAGEALQNAIYPQSWIDAEMARRARSPIATYVGGDVLPSLALMRPSARVLGEAGRGIRSLAGQAFNPGVRIPEAAALANVGIGAALGGGIEGGRQMVEGEFRPGRLAAETLFWAVSTEPTRLGRLLSGGVFRPTPLTRDYPTELAARMTGAGVQPPAAEPIQPNPLATLGRELGSRGSVKGARPAKAVSADFPEMLRPGTLRKPKVAAAENPFFQEAEQTAPARNIYDRPGAVEQQLQLDPNLPEAFLREFESFAAERLGAGVRQAPEIVMPGGGRARGSATPRTAPDQPAVIDVDVNRAVRETLPHEALHTMEDTIGQYGGEKVKALWTQLRATVGKDFADANPEYVAKYGYDAAVTEGLAQRVGSRFIEYLGGKEPGMLRKLTTALKVRRGTATPAESVDFATHKLLRSAGTEGYESRVGNVGEKMGAMAAGEERKPEEPAKKTSYTYEKPVVEKPVEQAEPVKTSSYLYEKPPVTKPAPAVAETKPTTEGVSNAIQEQKAGEGVLGEKRPEVGLQEVEEGGKVEAGKREEVSGVEPSRAPAPKYQPAAEDTIHEDLAKVGNEQRGRAEQLGVGSVGEDTPLGKAHRIMTGQLTYDLEHMGDLIHRLSSNDGDKYFVAYSGGGAEYGKDSALSKINRVLREEKYINSVGGLEAALRTDVTSNYNYGKKRGQSSYDSVEAAMAAAKDYLREYAKEHGALKPVTRLQQLAQKITRALGNLDTREYFNNLRVLKSELESPDWQSKYYERAADTRYQPAPDEGSDVFSTEAAKEFRKPTPFNSLQPGKDGTFATRNVLDVLRTKLSPTENEMLYEPVAKALAGKERVSRDEVLRAIDENVPRLEVKTLEAQEASNTAKRLAELSHWLDTSVDEHNQMWIRQLASEREYSGENSSSYREAWEQIDPKYHTQAKEYAELHVNDRTGRSKNDSATARYTQVNPRELKDMPGAVDLLVKIGGKKILPADATHYDKSGENALVHLRAYEHTMPDGEKVLRVFEVQSDWGQKRRDIDTRLAKRAELKKKIAEREAELRAQPKDPNMAYAYPDDLARMRAELNSIPDVSENYIPNHPLLPHSQRLALKAAIEHARKRGIKRIVVDDAETAMLTEGHDQVAAKASRMDVQSLRDWYTKKELRQDVPANLDDQLAADFGETWESGKYVKYEDRVYRVDAPEENAPKGKIALARELQPYGMGETDRYIPQEGGMRLAYDGSFEIRDASGKPVTDKRFDTAAEAERYATNVLRLKKASVYPKDWKGSRDRADFTLKSGTLHDAMRDLSGAEGVRVELGEHKNAVQKKMVEGRFATEQEAREWLGSDVGKVYPEHFRDGNVSTDWLGYKEPNLPRPDLIFREPSGQPKTTSTGFSYDVSAPQARRAAGEPFTTTRPKYQAAEDEGQRLTVNDVDWDMLGAMEELGVADVFRFAPKTRRMAIEKPKLFGSFDTEILAIKPQKGLLSREGAWARAVTTGDKNEGTVLIDQDLWKRAVADEDNSRELFLRALKHELGHIDDARNLGEDSARDERVAEEFAARYQPDDDTYLDLAKRFDAGDKTAEPELRRMVDEAAKARGFEPVEYYHGTQKSFRPPYKFDKRRTATGRLDESAARGGFAFTPNKAMAEDYAGITRGVAPGTLYKVYLNLGKIADGADPKFVERYVADAVSHYDDFMRNKANKKAWDLLDENGNLDEAKIAENLREHETTVREKLASNNYGYMEAPERLKRYGYNSAYTQENANHHRASIRNVFVLEPEQIKLSDVVTKDDSGNIIPLSQRFNAASPDIRYQPSDDSMTFGPDAMRDGKPAEKTPITQRIRGFFAGESEKLRRRGGPFAYAADKIEQIYNNSRSMAADYYTPFETEALKLSADERNVLMTALYKADQTGKDLRSTLKPSLLPAYDAYRAMMKRSRADQLKANQRNVEGELPGEDPTYFGNVVSREMLQILHRKPGSEEYARARKEFVDYNTNRYVQRKGMPREAALKLAEAHFNKYVKQLTVDRGVEEAFSFGAVQLPAGSKLPPSWIEPDLLDATRRYMNRFAKDRAFYDVIRKDEKASAALGLENYYDEQGNIVPVNDAIAREYEPVKGAQEVSHLLAGYVGAGKRTDDSFFPAVGRFINSLILAGPSTRAVDWLTTPFKAMSFVEPQHVPGLLKAVTFGIPEGMKSGVKTGLIKRNDMIVAREILGAGEELASKLDKATETIVKYTGTELLERYSRASAQAAGEYIAKIHRAMAANGNAKSKSFLSKFGPDAEKVDVTELGTRIAQLFQGKYDLTNLPKWAVDSQVAPFLSMMRWNVEQWNNFRKHVYAPAKEGNLTPALMTAVASVLGGLSIETLREQIMRKKSENASIAELLNAPDEEEAMKAAAAKLVASMQNTAMLGIVGEIGMYALDAVQGNNVRGFRFPTYEFAADVLGRGASAADAIMDGEDVVKVLGQYTADITTQHVQMARFVERMMAEYGLSDSAADKLKDMNARRDVRMFGKLSGLPKSQSPVKFSPYRKLSEKEFDEAKSVEEAKAVLPALKKRAQERAGGDRRRLEEEMRTIRTIGGRVGPSPSANPQRFRDYVAYLRKTQGPAAAEEYRSEALKDERLRKAKARLVR